MKDDVTHGDTWLQEELMSKCFQSVFTKESKFEGERAWHRDNVMREIQVDISEIKKIMKDLHVSKGKDWMECPTGYLRNVVNNWQKVYTIP